MLQKTESHGEAHSGRGGPGKARIGRQRYSRVLWAEERRELREELIRRGMRTISDECLTNRHDRCQMPNCMCICHEPE